MKFVNSLLELVKQLLFFTLKILELLQSDLVLPLNFLQYNVLFSNTLLCLLEMVHYASVLKFLFSQFLQFFRCLLKRFNNLLVSFFLIHLLFLFGGIFFFGIAQLVLKLLNDIQVSVSYLLVVVFNILIFFLMLASQILYCLVFLCLNG